MLRNLLVMVAMGLALGAEAQVAIAETDSSLVLENGHLRVTVARAGGRIAQLVDKLTGGDLVALWQGGNEIGGLLDDRLYFTSARYDAVVSESPAQVSVRLSAEHGSGISVAKTISLRQGERLVRVSYDFTNGSQQPARLWVRNFPVPGGAPLGEHHLYTLSLHSGPRRQAFASEYFTDLREPWAALHDTVTGAGLLALVPGTEKFYFWQGSRQNPTFEWLYPELPAGQRLETCLALLLVDEAAPDWTNYARQLLPSVPPPVCSELSGWIDEATRFGVTEAERDRGYWLSIGQGDGKELLPQVLELDLPLDGVRSLYVAINALAPFPPAALVAQIEGELAGWVQLGWERSEENAIVVAPLAAGLDAPLVSGDEYRIWLEARARGREADTYEGALLLEIGDSRVRVPMRVRIWPVRVPDIRPFDMRGYGTVTSFTGDYAVTPASLRQLDAMLEAYAAVGGSVLDWTVSWSSALVHVGIEGTGQLLSQQAPTLPLDDLPRLDFRYYDPWLDKAREHGVTRIETYMSVLSSSRWQWSCLDAAVGKGRVQYGTPEAERVICWIYGELRRYFESHGFRGFFCKISDEISPEHVPEYISTARVARRAGWRPFTTVTGIVARTAATIDEMNPHCDQWQVALTLKDDFRDVARVDADDEVWFYGGSSRPYRTPYERAMWYPMLAAAEGADGYGWWAFQWWQDSEKIVWYEPGADQVRFGPTFLGLRDGWEDARLFHWAVRELAAFPMEAAVSANAGALIQLREETREVYRWTTIANLGSPLALNELRRRLLRAAAEGTRE